MPYEDSVGKLTIGVGRNLTDKGLSASEVDFLLQNDISEAIRDTLRLFPDLYQISAPRQHVLINMMFNMGLPTLSKFTKMIEAVHAREWKKASDEMLDSRWAQQVGPRAERLAAEMEEGEFIDE